MDFYQLRTFAVVARERSITRASELLRLSQPAVSAHIKALEEALGLSLFERTPRGMTLTRDGVRLLVKAQQTLAAHQELMDEATRIKGNLTGRLRLGASSNTNDDVASRLLATLAARYPDVQVTLEHGSSGDVLAGIGNGRLDAGFYNEADEVDPELAIIEVSRFAIHLVAPRGVVGVAAPPDWKALAELSWVYPTSSACCGRMAERLFKTHRIRPKRILNVDREDVTRTLIAGGVGVGLLHADTAKAARARGEVDPVYECEPAVRVLFASLASRAKDPVIDAAASIVRGSAP